MIMYIISILLSLIIEYGIIISKGLNYKLLVHSLRIVKQMKHHTCCSMCIASSYFWSKDTISFNPFNSFRYNYMAAGESLLFISFLLNYDVK